MNEEKLEIANKLQEEINKTDKAVTHCKIMLDNKHTIIIGSRSTNDFDFRLPEDVRECVMRTALAALENKLEKLKKEFEEL